MLEHSVVSDQSDEAKNTNAISTGISTLVINPDILQEHTVKDVVKNKLKTTLAIKEPVTQQVFTLKKTIWNKAPNNSDLDDYRPEYRESMGFETAAATMGDFIRLHQSQLKRHNSAHVLSKRKGMCCTLKGTEAEACIQWGRLGIDGRTCSAYGGTMEIIASIEFW